MSIKLRNIKASDMEIIYEWISDLSVRDAAFSTDEISLTDHESWFDKRLKDSIDSYFIGEVNDEAIGQVRFSTEKNPPEVSIIVAKNFRSKGLGTQLLTEACQKFSKENDAERIEALVRADNPASQKLFIKSGFHEQERLEVKGVPAIRYAWSNRD